MKDRTHSIEHRRGGGEHPQLDVPKLIRDLRSGGEYALHARKQLSLLGDLGLAALLEQSIVDTKTKLGQQVMLENAIETLLDDPNMHGIMIATDLVGFGEYNKKYGQKIGDEIITLAAQALLSSIRTSRSNYTDGLYLLENDQYDYESDAYRIGGDEFAALLRDDKPLGDVDLDSVLRDKLLGVVTNGPLVELLDELGADGFGIRGSATVINPETHHSYADIIAAADPKVRTLATFVLRRSPEGVLLPVEL